MRQVRWLMVFAGIASGQWKHFQSSLGRDMLAAHNAVRARVHVPPLVWSDRLAARSQSWADRLLAKRQFAHDANSPYGENLFEISGAEASTGQVVDAWAGESRHYDYDSNTC